MFVRPSQPDWVLELAAKSCVWRPIGSGTRFPSCRQETWWIPWCCRCLSGQSFCRCCAMGSPRRSRLNLRRQTSFQRWSVTLLRRFVRLLVLRSVNSCMNPAFCLALVRSHFVCWAWTQPIGLHWDLCVWFRLCVNRSHQLSLAKVLDFHDFRLKAALRATSNRSFLVICVCSCYATVICVWSCYATWGKLHCRSLLTVHSACRDLIGLHSSWHRWSALTHWLKYEAPRSAYSDLN